jgi:hypothetical protein
LVSERTASAEAINLHHRIIGKSKLVNVLHFLQRAIQIRKLCLCHTLDFEPFRSIASAQKKRAESDKHAKKKQLLSHGQTVVKLAMYVNRGVGLLCIGGCLCYGSYVGQSLLRGSNIEIVAFNGSCSCTVDILKLNGLSAPL